MTASEDYRSQAKIKGSWLWELKKKLQQESTANWSLEVTSTKIKNASCTKRVID